MQVQENMLIFAASIGEFAERMTTFMACKGRFEPQPYEPSLSRVVALFLFRLLGDGDAILHQVLVRTLQAYGQFHFSMLHDEQLLKLLLVSSVSFGRLFTSLDCLFENLRQSEYSAR